MDEMRGSRMVAFGAIMLMLVGGINVLDGLVAVNNKPYFKEHLLFSNLTAWGWFFICYGTIQFFIGLFVFTGSRLAQWLGIGVAAINALAQLAYVDHYPAWSLTMVVIDVVVIYSLVRYGTVLGGDRWDASYHELPSERPAPGYAGAGRPVA